MKKNSLFFLIAILTLTICCKEDYTPKPYGFYRIQFPEKSYSQSTTTDLPYHFAVATEAIVEKDKALDAEPFWININYPQYNARINMSYKEINTDTSLISYLQDCHKLAYAHTIKAESIDEKFFRNKNGVFGVLYTIEGNTASASQFFITDSCRHFVRGALYFNERPNRDSLSPVIEYLTKDIVQLMESMSFK